MKSELNEREKAQLANIDEFNASVAQQGWQLKGKRLFNLNLSRIELPKSSLADVEMIRVIAHDARVTGTSFDGVDFNFTDFARAAFSNVTFTNCKFTGAAFKNSTFAGCKFEQITADEAEFDSARFQDCTFTDFKDHAGKFGHAAFISCRFQKPKWEKTSLYYAHFDSTEFDNGKLERVIFANTDVPALNFSRCAVDFCSFNETRSEQLRFRSCSSQRVTFGKAELGELHLSECSDFGGLALLNSTCRLLAITDCKGVSEPKFYQTKLQQLRITNSKVEYFYGVESEFLAGGEISNSTITGLNIAQAVVKNLTITQSKIEKYLSVEGARFENLSLKQVDYSGKLEFLDAGVTYTDSDRFAPPR